MTGPCGAGRGDTMSGPNGDPAVMEDRVEEDGDDLSGEEYAQINSMLDQINNCLDDLEDRNDSLNGKLRELLESNRQARLEFRAQLLDGPPQEAGKDHEEDDEDDDEEEDSSSTSQEDQDVEKS